MSLEDGKMCGDWGQEEILDHLQGRLPAGESARFQAHAAACASCRASLEDLTAIAALAATPIRPGRAAEDNVLAAIRAEAARRSPRAVKPATRRRLRRLAGTPSTAAAAWIFAAAALFMAVVVSAMITSAPAERTPVVRTPAPTLPPPVVEPPTAPPRPEPPKPAPRPVPRIEVPTPAPVEPPRDPAPPPPAPPAPPPKPKPPTIAEPRPAAVEVARVLRAAGKHAAGDKVVSGDTVQAAGGVLLLETADRSQIALKAGTTLVAEAQGEQVTLRLAEGEVACAVRTRPERRFSVQTTHGTATVKGTIFAVRATSAGTVLTVAKGRVEARTDSGAQDVAGGERCSMSRSTSPGRPEAVHADRLLSWAYDAGLPTPGTIWMLAGGPTAEFQAPMTRGRLFAAGSLSGEPVFAAVDSRTLPGWTGRYLPPNQREGGWVTYVVDVPEAGPWYLWGRFYSPGSGTTLWRENAEPRENDPNSFYVSVDGGPERVFGNHKSDPEAKILGYRRWYWGGDGKIELGQPAALPLGTLAKGKHTIRVRNRDAVETAALHLAPRLDALCLTIDKDYRPRDEDFRK